MKVLCSNLEKIKIELYKRGVNDLYCFIIQPGDSYLDKLNMMNLILGSDRW